MNELEQQLMEIPHFQFIHEHLFISAQPSQQQLESIKAYGVHTVINIALNSDETSLENEDEMCLNLGLNYLHLPLSLDMPSDEQCILILDLVHHLVQEKMVWLHCSNSLRVSSLLYLYQQYYLGLDLATAHELLYQVWEPDNTWTGLLHAVALQLQGRKSTEELQQSLQQVEA